MPKKVTLTADPAKGRCTSDHDVRLRFADSIILINNFPYYAKKREEEIEWNYIKAYQYKTEEDRFERYGTLYKYNDPSISTNFDLGYINYEKHNFACYISRVPVRRYKQGLDRGNTIASGIDNMQYDLNYAHIAKTLLPNTKENRKLLYPSLDKYLKTVKSYDKANREWYYQNHISSALSKNLAISKKVSEIKDENIPFQIYVDNNYVADFHLINGISMKKDGLYSVYHEYLTEVGL